MELLKDVQKYFPIKEFRFSQKQIIEQILSGRDVLAILPTGAGKSLCYQYPALKFPGITLVISPLIALMEDQTKHLKELNIPAACLNKDVPGKERRQILLDAVEGKYKLLFISPERLISPKFIRIAKKLKISLLVVDEVHCTSLWGYDFRPEYLKIPRFFQMTGSRPVIAGFTATATEYVKNDVIRLLQMNDPFIVNGGYERKVFYDNQPKEKQEAYKEMLIILGSLSRLFSTAEEPYLYYRAHENIFAKYFEVENNSRNDDSADACDIRNGIGIGLKTWVGQDNQKIAEFGRLRPTYADLEGLELVTTIAKYRNLRIRTTMNMHGLNKMLYHIVKRVPHAMCIYEAAYDYIDIENIEVDENRGNANSIYFTDGKHTYHFSRSKNTLYMIFDNMELMDEFEVQIYDDPYDILSNAMRLKTGAEKIIHKQEAGGLEDKKPCLCLRLYSTKQDGTKFVAEKSGLNQWNGVRSCYKKDKETGERIKVKETPRDVNELYIPYPSIDRNRGSFFPPRDTAFELRLPDGEWISAKVCQQDGKAIMSNPNNLLGKWLLRDVLELQEGTQITYEMLKEYGIDSVIFTKLDEGKYSIDFCELGTYEKVYGLEDIDAKNDVSDE